MPMQAISAGLLAGGVGFSSTFPVVLQGFVAVGSRPFPAASGLVAVFNAIGPCGNLPVLLKRPADSCAWSTPGAALLGGFQHNLALLHNRSCPRTYPVAYSGGGVKSQKKKR